MAASNPAFPPSNQTPYPSQQPLNPYPPPNLQTYGAYPPPPVETVPAAAAYPPPPSYENAVSGGKQPVQMPPYNYSYQTQPVTTVQYPSNNYNRDVEGLYSGEPEAIIIGFSDKSIRLGFIRRVFGILLLQLMTTVGTICLFIFSDTVRHFVQRNWGIYISAYVLFFVLYFVLVCCDGVRRNYPTNLILLIVFTLSLSYLVGVISSFHETNIVLIMMGVTTLVCASVMIFACQTKYDFTTWGGVLFCAALAIFFLGVFTPMWLALSTTVGKIFIGGALALVFVAFLAYDVQLIMGGKKYELSPEEHIFASLALYMDIIRIFLLLLMLFGGRGSS